MANSGCVSPTRKTKELDDKWYWESDTVVQRVLQLRDAVEAGERGRVERLMHKQKTKRKFSLIDQEVGPLPAEDSVRVDDEMRKSIMRLLNMHGFQAESLAMLSCVARASVMAMWKQFDLAEKRRTDGQQNAFNQSVQLALCANGLRNVTELHDFYVQRVQRAEQHAERSARRFLKVRRELDPDDLPNERLNLIDEIDHEETGEGVDGVVIKRSPPENLPPRRRLFAKKPDDAGQPHLSTSTSVLNFNTVDNGNKVAPVRSSSLDGVALEPAAKRKVGRPRKNPILLPNVGLFMKEKEPKKEGEGDKEKDIIPNGAVPAEEEAEIVEAEGAAPLGGIEEEAKEEGPTEEERETTEEVAVARAAAGGGEADSVQAINGSITTDSGSIDTAGTSSVKNSPLIDDSVAVVRSRRLAMKRENMAAAAAARGNGEVEDTEQAKREPYPISGTPLLSDDDAPLALMIGLSASSTAKKRGRPRKIKEGGDEGKKMQETPREKRGPGRPRKRPLSEAISDDNSGVKPSSDCSSPVKSSESSSDSQSSPAKKTEIELTINIEPVS